MLEESLYLVSHWRKLANFPGFQQNNNVFPQKNRVLKKYQSRQKVHILVISREFRQFWQNNRVIMKNKSRI